MNTNGMSMNDMPTFTGIDNSGIDNSMFTQSQTIPVPINNLDSKMTESTPPVENVTMSIPTITSGSSRSLVMSSNSNLNSSNSKPTSSTSVPTVSAHNHVTPSNVNHTPNKPTSISHQSTIPNTNQILTKTRLQDLVKEIDPCEQLDEEVEDLLLQLVDDFVNSTVNTACIYAKHRNAGTVEVKDVQLYLEKMYQMWIPGFGTEEVKPYKKPPVTEAHKQRLALIRKSLKKY